MILPNIWEKKCSEPPTSTGSSCFLPDRNGFAAGILWSSSAFLHQDQTTKPRVSLSSKVSCMWVCLKMMTKPQWWTLNGGFLMILSAISRRLMGPMHVFLGMSGLRSYDRRIKLPKSHMSLGRAAPLHLQKPPHLSKKRSNGGR